MEIRKLNMLRGLAAMIVVVTHFSDVTGWLDNSFGGRAGQYGVMLFFLLSGFLISFLYINKPFSISNAKHYLLARGGRVLPLFLLVVFVSYGLESWGYPGLYEIDNSKELASHLMFVYGESVLWTIAPEMQFYLLFILVWAICSWRPGYLYLTVVSILIGLFLMNFPRPNGELDGYPYDFHLFRNLPYFLVGMLLGKHYTSIVVPHYLRSGFFVFALLLIPLLYPDFSPVRSDARERMWLSYEVLLVMASVFFCVVFLVPDNNRLMANRLGDFLGKISYSLYLLHMPILHQVNKLTLSTELKMLVFLGLSVFLAWVSFRFFEVPAAKLIRKRRAAG